MPRADRPRRLGLVVPVRDEQATIADCLTSLDVAGTTAGLPLEVAVVLDGCVDGSGAAVADVAPSLHCSVRVVAIDARNVGTARRVGMQALLSRVQLGDWLATTDADTTVPQDWFLRQLAHHSAGAALVVGTVRVEDWEGRPELQSPWVRAYQSRIHEGRHRHVHGANLAFSVAAYRRTGGFADVAGDEDVRLVRDFLAAGEAVVWATDLAVTTSARRDGRAPGGFADYLNALEGRLTDEQLAVTSGRWS